MRDPGNRRLAAPRRVSCSTIAHIYQLDCLGLPALRCGLLSKMLETGGGPPYNYRFDDEFVSLFLLEMSKHDPATSQLQQQYEDARANPPTIGIFVRTVITPLGAYVRVNADPAPDSPAGKAGIKLGDIITAVDDQPTNNHVDTLYKISSSALGSTISLTVVGGGEPRVLVTPEERDLDSLRRQISSGVPRKALLTVQGRRDLGYLRRQIRNCFPPVETELQELAQRRAKSLTAEISKARDEVRYKKAAADAKMPVNILKKAYGDYKFLRRCREARQGYLAVNISEEELARARQAVQRVEQKLKPQLDPDVDIDELWEQADSIGQPNTIVQAICQFRYSSLMQLYNQLAPEDKRMEKDF
jgi:hypothetical protein